MAFVHTPGAGGLAVLSRLPLEDGEVMAPVGEGWFPAWRVLAQTPIGEVQALQLHLRPPISDSGGIVSGYWQAGRIHREEIAAFAGPAALPLDRPTLVLGDLNEDHDGAAASWLRDRGLRSALEEYAPDATTWRWATSLGEVTHTLDHIFYGGALEPLEARALAAGRSDHLPLLAVFTRRP
jgi:endonuclease/exonuclease/phosphatase family metal-dependent hydrolase